MFWMGGCASCHASPTSKLLLAGGKALNTAFGTFYVPNISPDPEFGIGDWSTSEFVNAMVNGVSPSGQHYYPAFPYTYYSKMYIEDVMDLRAFLNTLPSSNHTTESHDLSFPYSFTRGIGLWKLLYSSPSKIQSSRPVSSPLQRGKYLAEGPGHCGACHTPRDKFGGAIVKRHLAGARSLEVDPDSPDSKAEWTPNITPHSEGLASWSERDIAYFFETGFTPDFDTVGGSMVEVQENMAHLPTTDLQAISSYLKSLPGIDKRD
jgi:mono/diheme cytochrome c family protein